MTTDFEEEEGREDWTRRQRRRIETRNRNPLRVLSSIVVVVVVVPLPVDVWRKEKLARRRDLAQAWNGPERRTRTRLGLTSLVRALPSLPLPNLEVLVAKLSLQNVSNHHPSLDGDPSASRSPSPPNLA